MSEGRASVVGRGSLASDVAYGMLADKRRRYAIHFLKQRGDDVTIRELADQVAAWENATAVENLTAAARKRVYIAMYQSHLPRLATEGVVDYDAPRGVARISASAADQDLYLEAVPGGSVPWSQFYVGLTAVNVCLVVLAWLDVAPFAAVPDIGLGVVVLVTFGVSAFVQTHQSRRMRFGDSGSPPELRVKSGWWPRRRRASR